jgi:large subunit ribosomal protein L28
LVALHPKGRFDHLVYSTNGTRKTKFSQFPLESGRFAYMVCDLFRTFMARICELTGTGPIKGSHIWRSGKAKKKGGIGTHVTAITKRRFFPNLQRVKAVVNGEVRYIRVTASAIKKGLITKPLKRTWKKGQTAKAA